jgi:citrate/tricarballylate utilization protein
MPTTPGRALGALYARNGLALSLALALALALFLVAGRWPVAARWRRCRPGGNFYAVFPHNLMVACLRPVFGLRCWHWPVGVTRFWREVSPQARVKPQRRPAPKRGDALR